MPIQYSASASYWCIMGPVLLGSVLHIHAGYHCKMSEEGKVIEVYGDLKGGLQFSQINVIPCIIKVGFPGMLPVSIHDSLLSFYRSLHW